MVFTKRSPSLDVKLAWVGDVELRLAEEESRRIEPFYLGR